MPGFAGDKPDPARIHTGWRKILDAPEAGNQIEAGICQDGFYLINRVTAFLVNFINSLPELILADKTGDAHCGELFFKIVYGSMDGDKVFRIDGDSPVLRSPTGG